MWQFYIATDSAGNINRTQIGTFNEAYIKGDAHIEGKLCFSKDICLQLVGEDLCVMNKDQPVVCLPQTTNAIQQSQTAGFASQSKYMTDHLVHYGQGINIHGIQPYLYHGMGLIAQGGVTAGTLSKK